ncbi:hypothetical protein DAI22_11g188600 [Oryza sativa Japonica Group]|nr:hypothetical protein DAI22_11g188600 [Oryza sativa Japonica Group]
MIASSPDSMDVTVRCALLQLLSYFVKLVVIVHQTQIFSCPVFVSQHFCLYPRAQFWILWGYMKERAHPPAREIVSL